jgi:RNA polymerase-binding transcription factor DksA
MRRTSKKYNSQNLLKLPVLNMRKESMGKKAKKLTQKELERYKQLLLEKRKEVLADLQSIEQNMFQDGGEISSMPVHLADIGTDNFEQEFSLELMEEAKRTLHEIQLALERIEDGTFGICEGLGIPIEKERLDAIPWTRYSLEYARQKEKENGPGFIKRRPIDIERDSEYEDEEAPEEDLEGFEDEDVDMEPLDDEEEPEEPAEEEFD